MDTNREQLLESISTMPQWKALRQIIEEELDSVCDLDKISSFEEMVGAKFCRKVYRELIRKIDGAKDALTFSG